MNRARQFIRVLFRRGFRVAGYSHTFERELTPEEVRQIDEWMAGVDQAFDVLSDELSKMPKFAASREKEKG